MTRLNGRLVKWDDDRGFGFIEADGTREQVFVHIKAIGEIATRPRLGDRVSYAIGRGRDGRPAARDVAMAGANPRDRAAERRGEPVAKRSPLSFRVLGAALLFGLVIANVLLGFAPGWLLWACLGMSVLSAWSYWLDKRFAEARQWRTPEATLQGFDLAGGIIGGLLAQHVFRHKTAKPEFVFVTAGIAVLHAALNVALLFGLFVLP
jgi:uncharacterized membrane protein YsdA (DUF1294 family)/cold shock CspA family protein